MHNFSVEKNYNLFHTLSLTPKPIPKPNPKQKPKQKPKPNFKLWYKFFVQKLLFSLPHESKQDKRINPTPNNRIEANHGPIEMPKKKNNTQLHQVP